MIINAYLLHTHQRGDTSLEVTMFTQDSGLMRLLYKGGRLPKKKSNLQHFQPLWIDYEERYGRFYLRALESTASTYIIPNISLSSAWYINELLYITQYPAQSEPALYHAYEFVLNAMANVNERSALERALRMFEMVLLQSLGQEVILTHTCLGEPVHSENYYMFFPGNGFKLANSGILGAYILSFSQNMLDDVKVLNAAKYIMRHAINHALDGRVLKSRALSLRIKQ